MTHGMTRDGRNTYHHAYAIELSKKVNSLAMNVTESGIDGEKTFPMVERLAALLPEIKNLRVVMILGGTNDIFHAGTSKTILANLLSMHKMVHQLSTPTAPVFTVAIAVPQSQWTVHHKIRLQLNSELHQYAAHCPFTEYLDMDPVLNITLTENKPLWSSDGLHLSALGYDKMGGLLYESLGALARRAAGWSEKKQSPAIC